MHRNSSLLFTLLACGVLATGCQDYPFAQRNPGGELLIRTHQVIAEGASDTDILFVIDNSGSMLDKQQALQRNAEAFVTQLAGFNNRFHLGIVTTDMSNTATDAGRLRMVGTGPAFLTAPDPNAPDAAAQRKTLIDLFNQTVASLSTLGDSQEAGLGAALAALSPSDPAVAARNAGFLRPNADLAVILLTDEDDCSAKASSRPAMLANVSVQAWCYQNDALLVPVEDVVTGLALAKGGNIAKVRVGLIAGGVLEGDGTFAPRGCVTAGGGAASAACGCWASSAEPYFCTSLATEFKQPCSSLGVCDTPAVSTTSAFCPGTADPAVCDVPRCTATPARRYDRFMAALRARRGASSAVQGVFADSICQGDYATSLLQIARDVVLSNCMTLPNAVGDVRNLRVSVAHSVGGYLTQPEALPRFDPNAPNDPSVCSRCEDCPKGAWSFTAPATTCLECGLTKQPGDDFAFSVLQPDL